MPEAALQALGAKPGDRLIWRVGKDGKVIIKKRDSDWFDSGGATIDFMNHRDQADDQER